MSAEAQAFSLSFPLHISIIESHASLSPPSDAMTFPSPPQPVVPPLRVSKASPSRSANQSPASPQDMPTRKSLPKQRDSGFSSLTPSTPTSPENRPISNYTIPPIQEVKPTQEPRPPNEVRAYQYPGPFELPTRKPTHRPQQSTPSRDFDEGLHVVETDQSDSTSDFEKIVGMRPPGLRPLSPQSDEARSISRFSSVGTISGKPFKRLFGGLGGAKKPQTTPLPAGLEFCFSNCARQIVFWCRRNPDSILSLPYPFKTAQRCKMLVPDQLVPAPNRPQARSIRLLAASTDVAVAMVHIEEVSKSWRVRVQHLLMHKDSLALHATRKRL